MAKYFQKGALWKSVTGSSIVDIFIYTLEDLIGTTFPEMFKSFGLYLQKLALREKCPYSELFWSDFFQGEKKKFSSFYVLLTPITLNLFTVFFENCNSRC